MGRLDSQNEPSFHDTYSKANIKVNLSTAEPINTCFSFTTTNTISIDAWEKGQIYDRTIRVFHAYVGPSGGKKGYQATTGENFISNICLHHNFCVFKQDKLLRH